MDSSICLSNLKPIYMSEEEIASSDIYLQENVVFEKGKKYMIRASSGRGKSSLLNFIYGSIFNYDGSISYPIPVKNSFELRQDCLSYVFQDLKLFSELSLMENIRLKNELTNHKTETEIEEWLRMAQLDYKKDSPVKTLSLGQRQRAAILRALCQPFQFLLLDEPFSHLDKKNTALFVSIILSEIEKQDAGIILTSLDKELLFEYDHVLNL